MVLHENLELQRIVDKMNDAYDIQDMETVSLYHKELWELSKEKNDTKGLLIARYFDTHNAFVNSNYDLCKEICLEILPDLIAMDMQLLVIRVYNSLGIIESERSNYYESLSYYLKALNISTQNPEFEFSAVLANNIGNLFVWLNDFEPALPYLLKAYQFYKKDDNNHPLDEATIVINIIECYGYLGEYEEAYTWYHLPIQYNDICQRLADNLILCNEIEQSYHKNKIDSIPATINKIIKNTTYENEYIYHFRTLMRVFKVCLKMKNKVLCDQLINAMDALHNELNIYTFLYDYSMYKLNYCHVFRDEIKDPDFIEKCTKEYYIRCQDVIMQLRSTYSHSMVVQIEMQNIENEKQSIIDQNAILEKNIELDYFTHIYNKISSQHHIEDHIKTLHAQQSCALFIIDIDFFKNVNDIYGHEKGDEILLDVVSLIKEHADSNTIYGRFGGDEFLFFLKDASDSAFVEGKAKDLVEKARNICVQKDDNKYITFSIGIAIGTLENDFNELFQRADKALYKRKHAGRNGYTIN